MDNGTSPARATLEAWRERGADRMDSVRFHFIDAMARRATGYGGEVRKVLDGKLERLIEAYASDLERASSTPDRAGEPGPGTGTDSGSAAAHSRPARGPLGELVDLLQTRSQIHGDGLVGHGAASDAASGASVDVLDYFRDVWSKVSTERQLRQSFEQVPGNAGPLNSDSLIYRTLTLMRELSPDYLQQFLAYVDTLSWMEEMGGGLALPGKDATRSVSAKKNAKGKSR